MERPIYAASLAPLPQHAVQAGHLLCTAGRRTRHAAVGQGGFSAGSHTSSRLSARGVPLFQVSKKVAPRGAQVPTYQEDTYTHRGAWGRQKGGAVFR